MLLSLKWLFSQTSVYLKPLECCLDVSVSSGGSVSRLVEDWGRFLVLCIGWNFIYVKLSVAQYLRFLQKEPLFQRTQVAIVVELEAAVQEIRTQDPTQGLSLGRDSFISK